MAKADRTGNRKSREKKRYRTPDLGHYFILTDTEATEKCYINGLKDSLPSELKDRIMIHVDDARTSDLVERCLELASTDAQYSQPWIVFDRDKVTNFDDIIRDAKEKDIRVGWSNPCIEIWFEAYWGTMKAPIDSVACCNDFKELFQRKTKREYHKSDKDIYALLNRYGDEETAIKTAENMLRTHLSGGVTSPSKMIPATTLHYLVDEIRRKTSTAMVSK